ncbi:c-type cytochrome [Caldilinea sp.]|uniref:c-type cytochrome n=1 Tax=Caldilinea sp. TaxID=2293560 RepID=UPI002CF0FB12|nr:c-type cytochrome [Anaerolineales bacterium]HQY90036.1 c-type cytochrome [Caldilinea sp.]HRA65942.1 c-type cytochrome [Caldilinea sp.]
MNLHLHRFRSISILFFLLAMALLTGACRNEAAEAFPTSTPIVAYTPWANQGDAVPPVNAQADAQATATTEPPALIGSTATVETTVAVEPSPIELPTELPTETMTPTAAAIPTDTPAPTIEPTATPEPLVTAEPTLTIAPTPAPTEEAAETGAAPSAPTGEDLLPAAVADLLKTADAANGEQLTVANGCIACHSLQEGVVMVGPSWHNIGAVAATRVAGESAAAYLYQSITEPNAHVVEGFLPNLMPATYQDTLAPGQIADIIAYLLSLGAE